MFTKEQEINLLLGERYPQKNPGRINPLKAIKDSCLFLLLIMTVYMSQIGLSKILNEMFSCVLLHSSITYVMNGQLFFVQCGKSRMTALMMNISSYLIIHTVLFGITSFTFHFATIDIAIRYFNSMCVSDTETSILMVSIARFLETVHWSIVLFCRQEMRFTVVLNVNLTMIVLMSLYATGRYPQVVDVYPISIMIAQIFETIIVLLDFYKEFPKHLRREFSPSKYCYFELFSCTVTALIRVLAQCVIYSAIILFSIKEDEGVSEDESMRVFLVSLGAITMITPQINYKMVKLKEIIKVVPTILINCIIFISNEAFNTVAFETQKEFHIILLYFLACEFLEFGTEILVKHMRLVESSLLAFVLLCILLYNFSSYPFIEFTHVRLAEFLLFRFGCHLAIFLGEFLRLCKKEKRRFVF